MNFLNDYNLFFLLGSNTALPPCRLHRRQPHTMLEQPVTSASKTPSTIAFSFRRDPDLREFGQETNQVGSQDGKGKLVIIGTCMLHMYIMGVWF